MKGEIQAKDSIIGFQIERGGEAEAMDIDVIVRWAGEKSREAESNCRTERKIIEEGFRPRDDFQSLVNLLLAQPKLSAKNPESKSFSAAMRDISLALSKIRHVQ